MARHVNSRVAVTMVAVLAALILTLMVMSEAANAAATGTVRSWGHNDEGQLGNGTSGPTTDSNVPVQVKNLSGVIKVKAGYYQALALENDGTVRAWGYNGQGGLGNGNNDDSSVPVKVKNLSGVKAIAAGYDHCLALKTDGTVRAWGSNYNGELGNGNTGTHSNVPVKVKNLSGIVSIAAGEDLSVALKKDGTVWTWGHNNYGQLGNGNTGTDTNVAVKVKTLSGVKAIATGSDGNHVLALKKDGTVRAWGYNGEGELGDGTSGPGTNSNVPVKVKNLSGVRAIAAGAVHSLALKTNGTVRAWGQGTEGELGNNLFGIKTIPVKVRNLSGVRAIAAGELHSLALKTDGTVRSWGDNTEGELGNGSASFGSAIPVKVKNLRGISAIAGGQNYSLAVKR